MESEASNEQKRAKKRPTRKGWFAADVRPKTKDQSFGLRDRNEHHRRPRRQPRAERQGQADAQPPTGCKSVGLGGGVSGGEESVRQADFGTLLQTPAHSGITNGKRRPRPSQTRGRLHGCFRISSTFDIGSQQFNQRIWQSGSTLKARAARPRQENPRVPLYGFKVVPFLRPRQPVLRAAESDETRTNDNRAMGRKLGRCNSLGS